MLLGRPRENQSAVTIHGRKSPEDNPHFGNGKVKDGGFLVSLSKPRRPG